MFGRFSRPHINGVNVPLLGACLCLTLLFFKCGSNATPQISDFAGVAGYPYDLPCSVLDGKRYLQNYFINRHLPVEVKTINENTFMITGYDDEPSYQNRYRYAAYLIQITPDGSTTGSRVTFKWLVTSRGRRERTLRPTDNDKEYTPRYVAEITQQVHLFLNSSCGHNIR